MRLLPGKAKRRKNQAFIRYIPGNSFLHRLDPRTKLVGLAAIASASFLTIRPLPMAIPLLFVLAVALCSGLLKNLLKGFALFIPLIIFVLFLDSFFAGDPAGTVYFSSYVWIFHPVLSESRIMFALAMAMRLLSIGGFSLLFIMTTDYTAFVKSLKQMKFPATFSFSLGYALRSITGLYQDIGYIMEAQRSRGLEYDRNVVSKGRNALMAVTIPMTVSVLKRSQHVSDAMQSRGFGSSVQPTIYRPQQFGRRDMIMVAAYILLIVLVLLVR
jgi:energy-coupling factor transport system permease protein